MGKSSLLRGALEYYGSGAVLLAPNSEGDSYTGLLDKEGTKSYSVLSDPGFQPELDMWEATGARDSLRWLHSIYVEKKAKPELYPVVIVDTFSNLARLVYNESMAKFKMKEPPPAQSPNGASFYGFMRNRLEGTMRMLHSIRGLGSHLLVASHPKETEVTEIQKTDEGFKKKVLPDLPGGYKDIFPSEFSVVLGVGIGVKDGKRMHYITWAGNPQRVTKSRFGSMGDKNQIILPSKPKEAWELVDSRIQLAAKERV